MQFLNHSDVHASTHGEALDLNFDCSHRAPGDHTSQKMQVLAFNCNTISLYKLLLWKGLVLTVGF
jgi:hypothetical protein